MNNIPPFDLIFLVNVSHTYFCEMKREVFCSSYGSMETKKNVFLRYPWQRLLKEIQTFKAY